MSSEFNYRMKSHIYTLYYGDVLLFPLEGVMNTKIQAEHICRKLNSILNGGIEYL